MEDLSGMENENFDEGGMVFDLDDNDLRAGLI